MSNISESFAKEMEKAGELEKIKNDNIAKRALLDNNRLTSDIETMHANKANLEKAKSAKYGELTLEQVTKLQQDSDDYMEAAKHALPFITSTLDDVVPFFRKNFILIGATTGSGKSTAVANIVNKLMISRHPLTGKIPRTLVITNEEKAEDFYNRVTALMNGWHYTNHNKFTKVQTDKFRKSIPILASGGRLTVIDNNHNSSYGVTTTIEGIESIFENLIESKEYYDAVIIDYYQNIISSQKNPSWSENECQAKLSRMIDRYKNIYPAPIVMMCQINPPDKNDTPFQYRIKGRKIIMDPTTLAMEMVRNSEDLSTTWVIHKSRYTQSIGKDFKTGYDKGMFVPYTAAFAENVQKIRIEQSGSKYLPEKKDENGNG